MVPFLKASKAIVGLASWHNGENQYAVVAMRYLCDLGGGQCLYVENLHDQTLVTVVSSSPGQQQQSSSGFQTGKWTAPPELLRGAIGVVVRVQAAQGEQFVLLQGTSLSVLRNAPSLSEAQPLQVHPTDQKTDSMSPMTPIPSMQPMTMGNMQMDQGRMSMQMGNMQMAMDSIAHSADSTQANAPASDVTVGQRKFCSQCGTTIKPDDRFCAHCGHRLD